MEVRTTSLAGWQSGFAATGDSYVVAHGYGMTLDGITLSAVVDPPRY
jgi:hypothetical protein